MTLQVIDVFGYDSRSGVKKNKKPFLLEDSAFQTLENAYVYRERVKKRDGLKFLGRLRREIVDQAINNTPAADWTFNLYTEVGITKETYAEIEAGSVYIYINPTPATGVVSGYTNGGNCRVTAVAHGLSNGDIITISGVGVVPDTGDNLINELGPYTISNVSADHFRLNVSSNNWGVFASNGTWTAYTKDVFDTGDGLLGTDPVSGVTGIVNYLTGDVTLHGLTFPLPVEVSFNYFPALPVMGIQTRDLLQINDEMTVWWDTKYAYIFDGLGFQEWLPGTTWSGTDSQFFWATNFRGSNAFDSLFFVTNNNLNAAVPAGDPMRYANTDGTAWVTFQPLVDATNSLFSALILIPYYGRLLALNVWEGATSATSSHYYNRCRFSQVGSPIAADAWRTDVFGKGGFVDAPTNELIVSARFYKNTLIVQFERSTWRLQYVGEYGMPFIWERISSDWGADSTFSTVLFDEGVLAVGDKAIVSSSGTNVSRIDLDIPEEVYTFKNTDEGPIRVFGVRDFRRELVYWCYPDYVTLNDDQIYPNKLLVYNYRNNTYAFFRQNSTCMGSFQYPNGITWDRTDIFWDSQDVNWDNDVQAASPTVVVGNQQGFCSYIPTPGTEFSGNALINAKDEETLAVYAVTVTDVVTLTVINHNLQTGDWIYLAGLIYLNVEAAGSTSLNNQIYVVDYIDADNIVLNLWDFDSGQPYKDFTVTNVGDYIGGGIIALFPTLNIVTKDFNPSKHMGENIQTSYMDFLIDYAGPYSQVNINLQTNTSNDAQANITLGDQNLKASSVLFGYIIDIDNSNPCIIESVNHGLYDNQYVMFQEIVGSTELNGVQYQVTYIDDNHFSVDQGGVSAYVSGGVWYQVQSTYYTLENRYSWYRFFGNAYGQFVTLQITYNGDLMARLNTHQNDFVLNAMQLWFRPAGRNIFGR